MSDEPKPRRRFGDVQRPWALPSPFGILAPASPPAPEKPKPPPPPEPNAAPPVAAPPPPPPPSAPSPEPSQAALAKDPTVVRDVLIHAGMALARRPDPFGVEALRGIQLLLGDATPPAIRAVTARPLTTQPPPGASPSPAQPVVPFPASRTPPMAPEPPAVPAPVRLRVHHRAVLVLASELVAVGLPEFSEQLLQADRPVSLVQSLRALLRDHAAAFSTACTQAHAEGNPAEGERFSAHKRAIEMVRARVGGLAKTRAELVGALDLREAMAATCERPVRLLVLDRPLQSLPACPETIAVAPSWRLRSRPSGSPDGVAEELPEGAVAWFDWHATDDLVSWRLPVRRVIEAEEETSPDDRFVP